jgi:hypothetical protein
MSGLTDHLNKGRGTPDPNNPKQIVRVSAARHLSHEGPASFGYSCCEFQDVLFVDVEVVLLNGSHHTERTLVIKDRDDKWYVHPAPYVSPLLMYGLESETPSKQTFADVYEVEK